MIDRDDRRMCWLPVDLPPLPATCSTLGRSTCFFAAQLLAMRLRRIGDQLEKSWTSGGRTGGLGGTSTGITGRFGGTPLKTSVRVRLSSFLRAVLRLSALVLAVTRRHLYGARRPRGGSSSNR